MINGYWKDLEFVVQEGTIAQWRRVVDTSRESPSDIVEPGRAVPLRSLRCRVAARSLVVLVRERQ